MAPLPEALLRAAEDARYLLARGYPRERVLRVVGDRWNLDAAGRHLLRRGAFAPDQAQARQERLVRLEACRGRAVGVDGHNVLITLESALTGCPLLMADDGLVRDIAGRGANHRPGAATLQAAEMMINALAKAGAASAHIFLDAPLPKSGELAARLRGLLARAGLAGQALAVPVPEKNLACHCGPVASSDSALLDRVAEPLDLAGEIIRGLEPPITLERLTS